jgi:hypothetical protein
MSLLLWSSVGRSQLLLSVWILIKINKFKCIRICFYDLFPEYVAIKLYSVQTSTGLSVILIEGYCRLIHSVQGNGGMTFMVIFLSQWMSYINSVVTLNECVTLVAVTFIIHFQHLHARVSPFYGCCYQYFRCCICCILSVFGLKSWHFFSNGVISTFNLKSVLKRIWII